MYAPISPSFRLNREVEERKCVSPSRRAWKPILIDNRTLCNAIATDIYAPSLSPHGDALINSDLPSLIQLEPISSTLDREFALSDDSGE